jgi:ankyrin repeat protein
LLLASKSDIKARDIFGRTPLHWAAQQGFTDVVELLLANHAEIEARDKYGATPLDLAAALGRKEVVERLLANQADVNTTNNAGSTLLHSLMAQQQKESSAGTATLPQATQTAFQAMRAATLLRQKAVIEVLRQHGGHE